MPRKDDTTMTKVRTMQGVLDVSDCGWCLPGLSSFSPAHILSLLGPAPELALGISVPSGQFVRPRITSRCPMERNCLELGLASLSCTCFALTCLPGLLALRKVQDTYRP